MAKYKLSDLRSIKLFGSGSKGSDTFTAYDLMQSYMERTGDDIPSQTGNSGKVLTTNGTALSWASTLTALTVTTLTSTTGNITTVNATTVDATTVQGDTIQVTGVTGGLILPSLTLAERGALTPVDGLVIYQTDNTPGVYAYVDGSWTAL
jgi:hypothetical protein